MKASLTSALLLCVTTAQAAQSSIYSVQTIAQLTWLADDDSSLLSTSQIYQMENAATTFFQQVLNDWMITNNGDDGKAKQEPLSTRVATTNQVVELTRTGERLRFNLPSTVDLMYIGIEEIDSITQVLSNLTKSNLDSPAYLNMQTLAGASPSASFEISFSDPSAMKASTLIYTIEDTTDTNNASSSDQDSGQVGLIVACTFATLSLFLASLTLLWAVGAFDGWRPCKQMRSRFYMVSPRAVAAEHRNRTRDTKDDLPYGMTAASTAEETEDPEAAAVAAVDIQVGAKPKRSNDEYENDGMQDEGIEMTPSRGIFRVYSEYSDELLSPAGNSELTEQSNYSQQSFVAPLGISSMRKVRHEAESNELQATMSAEAILADIGALSIDLD